jgi:hypothetical protein
MAVVKSLNCPPQLGKPISRPAQFQRRIHRELCIVNTAQPKSWMSLSSRMLTLMFRYRSPHNVLSSTMLGLSTDENVVVRLDSVRGKGCIPIKVLLIWELYVASVAFSWMSSATAVQSRGSCTIWRSTFDERLSEAAKIISFHRNTAWSRVSSKLTSYSSCRGL